MHKGRRLATLEMASFTESEYCISDKSLRSEDNRLIAMGSPSERQPEGLKAARRS